MVTLQFQSNLVQTANSQSLRPSLKIWTYIAVAEIKESFIKHLDGSNQNKPEIKEKSVETGKRKNELFTQ